MSAVHIDKYEIDPLIFKKGFNTGCGPFACESSCCKAGVYVDIKEKERILSFKGLIPKYMDASQTPDADKWFDEEIEDDSDFPSGRAVGTNVYNDKCVFLDSQGKCSLQVMGTEEGMGRWAVKPFFCIAFPITIENGKITFDDFQQGKTQCCSIGENVPVRVLDSCKEELQFVLGNDGYQRLRTLADR
jgi:Protein of unknown function (DUF3109)